MRRSHGGLVAALVVGVALGLFGARRVAADGNDDADRLTGEWKLSGWNVGADREGKPSYTGSVSLTHRGKGTFEVTWSVGGRVVNTGIGLWDPRTKVFASGYSISGQAGVAVFQPSEDGKVLACVGTFKGKIGEVAWEEWRRD